MTAEIWRRDRYDADHQDAPVSYEILSVEDYPGTGPLRGTSKITVIAACHSYEAREAALRLLRPSE